MMTIPTAATEAGSPQASQATRRFQGESFAEGYELDGMDLKLRSLGLMRYGLLRAFAAALYLEEGERDPLADVAKRLELVYFLPIAGRLFGPAARSVLKKSNSRAELAELDERLRTIDAAYRDVGSGDRYALTYQPGIGTELSLNGRPLVLVPGADFACAYFAIWLGARPMDRRLRNQLTA